MVDDDDDDDVVVVAASLRHFVLPLRAATARGEWPESCREITLLEMHQKCRKILPWAPGNDLGAELPGEW